MKKLILLLIIFPLLSFQDVKYVKVKFTEEISGKLPASFIPMTTGDILRRLPSARAPLAAYTDEARVIDFSINVAAARWMEKDLVIAKDFYKSSIYNLYDELNLLKEEMVEIDGRQFAVFEFESLVKGDGVSKKSIRKYSYIQYTIDEGRTLVFGFNAPIQLKDKWQSRAAEIMNSVKIK